MGHRLVWGLLLAATACGTTTDDRPLTIEYVTDAILVPTCGAAQCHSTFKQQKGYVFDTVEAARRTIVDTGLVLFDSPTYDPATPFQSGLLLAVTVGNPFRMPYDAPMPNEDIQLLADWVKDGARGAQCDPGVGMACNNKDVVQCNPDWTFGTVVMTCPNDCINGVCQ